MMYTIPPEELSYYECPNCKWHGTEAEGRLWACGIVEVCPECYAELKEKEVSKERWFVCPNCRELEPDCWSLESPPNDYRPFKVTEDELAESEGVVKCEYCDTDCIELPVTEVRGEESIPQVPTTKV